MSIDDEDVCVICGYDGVDLCETCWVCTACCRCDEDTVAGDVALIEHLTDAYRKPLPQPEPYRTTP